MPGETPKPLVPHGGAELPRRSCSLSDSPATLHADSGIFLSARDAIHKGGATSVPTSACGSSRQQRPSATPRGGRLPCPLRTPADVRWTGPRPSPATDDKPLLCSPRPSWSPDGSPTNYGEWALPERGTPPDSASSKERHGGGGGPGNVWSSEQKPEEKACSIGLRVLVVVNIFLALAVVAIICIVPLEATSRKSLNSAVMLINNFASDAMADTIMNKFFMLSETVNTIATGLQLNQTQQLRSWSRYDMPVVMQHLCGIFNTSSYASELLYLQLSSPFSGYGAYCTQQYDGKTLVGKYTIDGESDYRYVVDPLTLTYATPRKPIAFVSRMTDRENAIDFAPRANPFAQIVIPWGDRKTGRRWLIFESLNETMVTYTYPFRDYRGELAAITGALQLKELYRNNQPVSSSSDIASSILVDLDTGLVLSSIPCRTKRTMWDNWNCSTTSSFCDKIRTITPQYLWNVNSIYMSAAIKKIGGKDGILTMLSQSNDSTLLFDYKGVSFVVSINRVNTGNSSLSVVSISIMPKNILTGVLEKARNIVVLVVAISALYIALLEMTLVCCFVRSFRGMAEGLGLMTEHRDDSGAMRGYCSMKEVVAMQRHLKMLNKQLMCLKSFLPHVVMEQKDVKPIDVDSKGISKEECGSNETPMVSVAVKGTNGSFIASKSSHTDLSENMSLHFNGSVLKDRVNRFRRRYCSVVCLSLALFYTDYSIDEMVQEYLEICIPLLMRYGGVLEIHRPEFLFITFGAHSNMPRNQTQAIRFVIELAHLLSPGIFERLGAFVDAGEFCVGTCGAANLNSRVTYGPQMFMQAELVRTMHFLKCHILVTGRVAVSIGEQFLTVPVDAVLCDYVNQPIILYELRGDTTGLEPSHAFELQEKARIIRHGFASMLRGKYEAAIHLLSTVDGKDPQADRLIHMCRRFIRKRITKPYIRHAGRTRSMTVCGRMRSGSITSMGGNNNNNTSGTFLSAPLGGDDMLSMLQVKRDIFDGGEDMGRKTFPDSKARTLPVLKSSSAAEAEAEAAVANPVDSMTQEISGEGLFTMFLESSDDEDEEPSLVHAAQTQGSASSVAPSLRSNAKGEPPFVFTDYRGSTWTRSSDKLGVGAFSVVYRGMSSSGDLVALKCFALRARNIDTEDIVEELKLFSQLRHENIVQYISCYFSTDFLIGVMELVPGGSLDSILTSFGRLPTMAVRRFLRDALHGLMYLHSMNVVHCDVKPHNVLVAMDGVCKLSDFGSSLLRLTNSVHRISDVLEMRGTPAYMAPEVTRGELPTGKSDVFSLGITVLELLTGRLPWAYVHANNNNNNNNNDNNDNNNSSNINDSDNTFDMMSVCAKVTGGTTNSTASALSLAQPNCDIDTVAASTRDGISDLLRSPAHLLICIGKGDVAPVIPQHLEDEVKDFLQACVAFDPARRSTVEELLRHPWML